VENLAILQSIVEVGKLWAKEGELDTETINVLASHVMQASIPYLEGLLYKKDRKTILREKKMKKKRIKSQCKKKSCEEK